MRLTYANKKPFPQRVFSNSTWQISTNSIEMFFHPEEVQCCVSCFVFFLCVFHKFHKFDHLMPKHKSMKKKNYFHSLEKKETKTISKLNERKKLETHWKISRWKTFLFHSRNVCVVTRGETKVLKWKIIEIKAESASAMRKKRSRSIAKQIATPQSFHFGPRARPAEWVRWKIH